MLELNDDNTKSVTIENIDGSVFDPIISNMPAERTDKQAHQRNYEAMLKIIDQAVKACSARGCYNIHLQDLPLKEEECSHQKLQLSYWLHIISFKQLFSDTELSSPAEITAMIPSSKKVPECLMPSDAMDDFFLERIAKVNVEGWEPILSLMHQFAEMFSFYDYITLGAKIAKYIDTKGRGGSAWGAWWCGAGGRGACALRCAAAALPPTHHRHHRHYALSALAALLHMQSKPHDGKDMAYLSFYASPKSKFEAFLVAVSHTYLGEYEKAVWMYRYALTFDDKFLPAKACLQATMCLMLYEEPITLSKD